MKQIKKFLRLFNFIAILSLAFLFASCSDDDSPSEDTTSTNTYEQDKLLVENQLDSYLDCMQNMEQGELSQLLLDLYDDYDNDNSSYHENLVEGFSDLNFGQVLNDLDYPFDSFNFSNYTGTYTYNSTLGIWTNQNANNLIEIIFPIFSNSSTNDLKIQLSGVTQELVDILDESVYIPTSLVLDVYYNSERVFGIQIENVEYEIQDEIPVPIDIDLKIFTSPFTHEVDIDRMDSKNFSVAYSLDNGSGCNTEVKTEIELLSSDYENLEDTDVKSISGYLLMNDLKFVYDGDMEYLLSIDDPTTTQINNYVDVDVLDNNTKIGELKLVEDTYGDYSILMVFMDGTQVDLQDFDGIGLDAEELIERIEGIISRYTNRLDD